MVYLFGETSSKKYLDLCVLKFLTIIANIIISHDT